MKIYPIISAPGEQTVEPEQISSAEEVLFKTPVTN
jgi:hypothetical protein